MSGNYVVRIYASPDSASAFDLVDVTEIAIVVSEPVTDALAQIMALAPSGWSVDSGGIRPRSRPYLRLAGQTVLAALRE
jgi:hypothetical protein